ncbi:MAG: YihY family inner membrane protein [Sulfurimonas sp.]
MKVLLKNYYIFLRDFINDLFDDKIGHYASSLSWSTIFSLIPLLVILLWIFTTLPLFHSVHQEIETLIFGNLMPAHSDEIREYINTFMQNSYKLGYVGLLYVIVAAILFFKNYDYIVNDIFGVSNRGLFSALKTYILLLLVIPILMGASFYLSASMQTYLDQYKITDSIHLIHFLPFLIIWMVFYLLYQFSANTQVIFSASVVSSFIASLVWYLSKNAFVYYVLHNKTYMSIYGSISTILFFLLWIYISWAIFLHGLKFCDLLNKGEEIEHI